ncbi:hypothetical protein [Planctomycetes bacterium K23_9]|uniref:Chromosome partition protein Smc n=1 Tax=Stieleria marina TaxID=1930275 RepID=A0A517NYP7_9BACT|nr:hypothetical protein K239x_42630 [Planctomycetes bacterium K23_9]
MNRIETRVASARRRLMAGTFGRALCYSLFTALIIATIALAAPAVWVMDIDAANWAYSWIGGTVLAAVIGAAAYTFATAPSQESVAAEVDHRFGLRERLSSSLSLDKDEQDTDFGAALMADAEKRAEQLEVADRFALKPSKLSWLPLSLVPILAIVFFLVDPISQSVASSTSKTDQAEVDQVKKVASQLKKRIQQQKRNADAKGLKEAKELFEKMEADLNKIASQKNMSRKEAMIAMNDLKKELEERRSQLGSSESMRKAMSQMKGLESGPGDKVAKSIEKGEFGKAKDIVKNLANKMRDGKLSKKEKEQLKKQVDQMKKQMQAAVKKHEQQKQDLQKKIEQARNEGRGADAAKMQQQLNQMQQRDGQMQQMQKMADAMNQAQQAMKNGKSAEAADALEQMADQLGEMQQEMSELEDLQSTLDELSQSKNQMRCKNCGGAGCQQCQGNGQFGMGNGEGQGNGLGRGNGSGDRPEEEGDTNTYETQVRGNVKKGKAIIAGFADGPNKKGVSREELKALVEGAMAEDAKALDNENLPRTEQEHATDYFNQLREGR